MVDRKLINKIIVFTLIAFLFIAAFFVLRPILMAVFIGVLFAYIVQPLYNPFKARIKNANLSTILFLICLIIVIAIPAWFLLPVFFNEVFDTYMYIQKVDLPSIATKIADNFFSPETARVIAVQLNLMISKFFAYSLDLVSSYFTDLAGIIINSAIFLFTVFFIIRDSDKIKQYLSELSPLSKSTEDKFAQAFRGITNSVVYGQIITGLVQGLALGLALWLLGVPQVMFLTVLAIIVSIIPLIGAWLVWLPVSIILIVSGQTTQGIFLFFYGLLFVSTIDNILRPMFLARQSNLSLFVAILGTIGGLYAFGFIGLIIGPLILSYLLIVIEFYKQGKLNELFRE